MAFLTPLENTLMEVLWNGLIGNGKDIHAAVSPSRSLTQSSVYSALHRLVQKGFLEREKVRGTWFYQPRVSRDRLRTLVKRSTF